MPPWAGPAPAARAGLTEVLHLDGLPPASLPLLPEGGADLVVATPEAAHQAEIALLPVPEAMGPEPLLPAGAAPALELAIPAPHAADLLLL